MTNASNGVELHDLPYESVHSDLNENGGSVAKLDAVVIDLDGKVETPAKNRYKELPRIEGYVFVRKKKKNFFYLLWNRFVSEKFQVEFYEHDKERIQPVNAFTCNPDIFKAVQLLGYSASTSTSETSRLPTVFAKCCPKTDYHRLFYSIAKFTDNNGDQKEVEVMLFLTENHIIRRTKSGKVSTLPVVCVSQIRHSPTRGIVEIGFSDSSQKGNSTYDGKGLNHIYGFVSCEGGEFSVRLFVVATLARAPLGLSVDYTNDTTSRFSEPALFLSVSQRLQLMYISFSSLAKAHYDHGVINCFYKHVKKGLCYLNLNSLPVTKLEGLYGHAVYLKSFFQALSFMDNIYGIFLQDSCRPDILDCLAPMVGNLRGHDLGVISLRNCSLNQSVNLFSSSLYEGRNKLRYLDLSGNGLVDLQDLCTALVKVEDIIGIDLSGNRMSSSSFELLMKVIYMSKGEDSKKRTMSNLKVLDLTGAETTVYGVSLFAKWLGFYSRSKGLYRLRQPGEQSPESYGARHPLQRLSLGSIKTGLPAVFKGIRHANIQLTHLNLTSCRISGRPLAGIVKAYYNFRRLRELNLTNTNLNPGELEDLFENIPYNFYLKPEDGRNGLRIILNEIDMSFKALLKMFQNLKKKLDEHNRQYDEQKPKSPQNILIDYTLVTGLGLAGVLRCTFTNVSPLFGAINDLLVNLRYLDISYSIPSTSWGVDSFIKSIFLFKYLQILVLKGNDTCYMGPKNGISFLVELCKAYDSGNCNIFSLDISNQRILDEGVHQLLNLVTKVKKLYKLTCDGQNFTSYETYKRFYSVIMDSSIFNCPEPYSDLGYMYSFLDKEDRNVFIDEYPYISNVYFSTLYDKRSNLFKHNPSYIEDLGTYPEVLLGTVLAEEYGSFSSRYESLHFDQDTQHHSIMKLYNVMFPFNDEYQCTRSRLIGDHQESGVNFIEHLLRDKSLNNQELYREVYSEDERTV